VCKDMSTIYGKQLLKGSERCSFSDRQLIFIVYDPEVEVECVIETVTAVEQQQWRSN
jgi:hypothetical protein